MSAIAQLVRRVRRRRQIHLVLQQAAVACAIGLGTSILLLITGTGLLDRAGMPGAWFWPLLAFAVSFAVLIRRGWRESASDYAVTQEIDRRLALRDSLSTALYFAENPEGAAEVIAWQRERAEEQARSADLRRAVPFVAPRSLYVTGWLALMAAGLFAARYGFTRSLDLRASLLHVVFRGEQAGLSRTEAAQTAAAREETRKKDQRGLEAGLETRAAGPDAATANELMETLAPAQAQKGSAGELQASAGDAAGGTAGQDGSAGPQSESAPVADGSQRLSEGVPGKQGNGNGSPSQTGAQQGAGDEQRSSLLDRMRDAMSGLLSKLTTPQNSSDKKGSPARGGNGRSGANKANTQGTPAQGQAQENSLAAGGRPDPNGALTQGMKAMRGSDQQGAPDSSDSPAGKSGIGRQDGRKDPRLAEQLQAAAMGKISEIIGRRSRTVTGDVVVEVSSGVQQQPKTAYSGRQAAHSDTTGEITRDEVPLIYQDYIQNYFDQIRKLPAPRAQPQP